MAKQIDPRLPKIDRQAMSMTKEQRLLARIQEHKRDAEYYRKRWLPSLVLGLAGVVLVLAWLLFPIYLPRIVLWLSALGVLNGFYWLYKFLNEVKQMEKLETFARQHGVL